MRYRFRDWPPEAYKWHRWYAWYPVLVFDPYGKRGAVVWLEEVERMFEYGRWRRPTYRLPLKEIVAKMRQV
jgi:hypothetical protein